MTVEKVLGPVSLDLLDGEDDGVADHHQSPGLDAVPLQELVDLMAAPSHAKGYVELARWTVDQVLDAGRCRG